MKIGDYCKLKKDANLEDRYPDKLLNFDDVYQIRDLTDWNLSLVGIGEERWIEGVGMIPAHYFLRIHFEKYEKYIDEPFESFKKRGELEAKKSADENALVIEGLVIKMYNYLTDQAKEEFTQSLDEDHQIMLHLVTNYSNLLKK